MAAEDVGEAEDSGVSSKRGLVSLLQLIRMNRQHGRTIIPGLFFTILDGASEVNMYAGLFFMFACIIFFTNGGRSFFFTHAAEKITYHTRRDVFHAMMRQDAALPDVNKCIGEAIPTFVAAVAAVVAGVAIAFAYDWRLTLVILATFPFLIFANYMEAMSVYAVDQGDEGPVANIRTVTTLTREHTFIKRFKDNSIGPYRKAKKNHYIGALGYGLCADFIGVQQMLNVMFAIEFSAMELGLFAQQSSLLKDYRKRIKVSRDQITGDIAARKVRFAYPTRPGATILRGITLGESPPIIGLVQRLYDVLGGSVDVERTDVRQWNVKSLRSNLALVGQEPVLFDYTIAGNIAYGRLDATQMEIEEVAKQANIHNFVIELPDGYNTRIGQTGGRLSGGQKQRIAIARALVPSSALDSQSEKLVQEALDIASEGRTTITIAHRLSTIQNADHIHGTHDQLLEQKGLYSLLSSSDDSTDDEYSFKDIEHYDFGIEELEDSSQPMPSGHDSSTHAQVSLSQGATNELLIPVALTLVICGGDSMSHSASDDLGVHNGKIAQVRGWLEMAMQPAAAGPSAFARILVVEGPAGAEWINPLSGRSSVAGALGFDIDEHQAAGRRRLLQGGKIVLVDDLPNILHRDTRESFKSALLRFISIPARQSFPLVIDLLDDASRRSWRLRDGDKSTNTEVATWCASDIIPRAVYSSAYCQSIKFNPVAPTIVSKGLKRILQIRQGLEGQKNVRFSPECTAAVKAISSESGGDIRSAITMLQLTQAAYTGMSSQSLTPRKRSRATKLVTGSDVVEGKNVLYAKRGPPGTADSNSGRGRLESSPSQIIGHLPVDMSTFNLFVHENSVDFCGSLDELTEALSYFSDADVVSSRGRTKHDAFETAAEIYSGMLTMHGFMHAKGHPELASQGSHRPSIQAFRKPMFFESYKKRMYNSRVASGLTAVDLLDLGSNAPTLAAWGGRMIDSLAFWAQIVPRQPGSSSVVRQRNPILQKLVLSDDDIEDFSD
ncbi:hypothetical protein DL89DRAFT_289973 [Linderina pennispora]|uniref:P-loop containing nucleoside triphosphate hydrolase protein n=1 Tax=Linderina pennispora TaxID=61395 RepID=A0A1Y1WLG3_9FUNG|nr:uncharacterized protein DL89DRAFT_289973 [Linderina pennispora]ORX74409.1 hypothetical protein DL89DRAFT_289973 [Linderina pennispora]